MVERRPSAIGEAVLEAGSGAIAAPIAGLRGLGTLVTGGGLDEAARNVQETQQALTISPRTELGRQASKVVAAPAIPFEKAGELGGKVLEEVGYPMAGATLHSAAVGLPTLLGAKKTYKTTRFDPVSVSTAKINKKIGSNIQKIIKPALKGMDSRSARQSLLNKNIQGVREIAARKDNLKFTDVDGNIVEGKLPRTMDEHAQAIDQVKADIYNQYNSLAQQAGEAGARVNLNGVKKALVDITLDDHMKRWQPDMVKRANEILDTSLKGLDDMTPEGVQRIIQDMNASHTEHYHTKTAESGSKSAVDAIVQNNLRRELDNMITKTTGVQYAPLKRSYGAVKSMEKSLNRRIAQEAKKADKGLIDFGDVYTVGQLVRSIGRADPAAGAAGITQSLMLRALERVKSGDARVKKMFDGLDEMIEKEITTPELPGKEVAAGAYVAGQQREQE